MTFLETINDTVAKIVGIRGDLHGQSIMVKREISFDKRKRDYYRCKNMSNVLHGYKDINDRPTSVFVLQLKEQFDAIHDSEAEFPDVENPVQEVLIQKEKIREGEELDESLTKVEEILKKDELDLIHAIESLGDKEHKDQAAMKEIEHISFKANQHIKEAENILKRINR